MLVYTDTKTSRLQYITAFAGTEITGSAWQLTSSIEEFRQHSSEKINYSSSRLGNDELWIKPHSLLFDTGIQEQTPGCFKHNDNIAFFKTEGDYAFDIFAASFYLLSRYEEYLPYKKDMYGRYDHQNSLAYKQGFLKLPLVNIWLLDFRKAITARFPQFPLQKIKVERINILPTYDIDMAWSYLHKGWWRTIGGLFRSLINGRRKELTERINVLQKKQPDPFDAYGWLNSLHEKYQLRPYYFFLVPAKKGRYDKNISPSCSAMKELIHDHMIRYRVGVHPSWRSGDEPALIREEINTLAGITGNCITASRQHYIRFALPGTFRYLLEAGIRFDFSMGYGSINGFRASVASPFYWYDLEKEQQTELLLFPYCFMEANSFYEQHYTAEQALEEMRYYYNVVKAVNGIFIMIWHNSFLGTARELKKWRDVYGEFIGEISTV